MIKIVKLRKGILDMIVVDMIKAKGIDINEIETGVQVEVKVEVEVEVEAGVGVGVGPEANMNISTKK